MKFKECGEMIPTFLMQIIQHPEFNQPNSGPIWDAREADFSAAAAALPARQNESGRPTSWAAKAYLELRHSRRKIC